MIEVINKHCCLLVAVLILISVGFSYGQHKEAVSDDGNISVHDPCIIKSDGIYYIFCTGLGITQWHSKDLTHWTKGKPVFQQAPSWTQKIVPGFRNFIWAPDISYYNGQYYLFYAVSTFGKNTSAIGLVVNKTLDEKDPNYHWTDHGIIVRSIPGRDVWNAIDPNLIVDSSGTPWLDFGSFWEGIKLVRLKQDRTGIAMPETWYTIASRPRHYGILDSVAGNAAIEGPFIFHHGKYYYLFVSYDYCCRGIYSNYRIMIGRSEKIMGPYVDKNGVPMIKGGATQLLAGDKHWPGVGHNAVLSAIGKDYLVFHGYDATDYGRPMLRILPIRWIRGWPEVNASDTAIVLK